MNNADGQRMNASGEAADGTAAQLDSQDSLLADVAARLRRDGQEALASALIGSADMSIAYGDSWWDGFDDYIYEVHVTVIVDPRVQSEMQAAELGLGRAIGQAVDFRRDDLGEWRRGTLETVVVQAGSVHVDSERRSQRDRMAQQQYDGLSK
ncbi:hypothetical protein ACFQU3_19605 [Terrabacter sp. GCM10028922]|uniref:hypothetical protein n=1 Tax=Terrabacter sp. GCM10028922 TaxID=3273428 RepID=UPI00360B0339